MHLPRPETRLFVLPLREIQREAAVLTHRPVRVPGAVQAVPTAAVAAVPGHPEAVTHPVLPAAVPGHHPVAVAAVLVAAEDNQIIKKGKTL
jgi:hypothetical protein